MAVKRSKKLKFKYSIKKDRLLSIFKDSSIRKSFFVIIIICMLLANSFAWLYDEFIGNGADITIGEISHEVVQYDSSGEIISTEDDTQTIIYESNMSNVTKDSKIIAITNTGTLDMEFSMTFTLEGTTNVAGILYYRLYEVTDKVIEYEGSNDNKVKSYTKNNPVSPTIESDTDVVISNMTLLNNDITIDQIKTGETKYYRLDYGMYQIVNTSIYSNESFSVHMNVYSSQVGVITAEANAGQVWNVQNEAQLREVLLSALAGDTIRLNDDITIQGSLNIPKRINIDTNDYKLAITEDLIYEFVSIGDLNIDVSGTGKLVVGSNLYITAPKSNVNIIGDNKKYDIVVGKEMQVSAVQADGSDGLFLDNVRIVKSSSNLIPVDLIVKSNTRVTLGPDVEVGYIYSYEGSTNIEIINNGYITQIDLSNMKLLDTFTKYQIYVYNLGEIYGAVGSSSIILPSNATPYKKANDGNTLIIKGVTSGDITISGSDNFKQDDIIATEADITVQPVDGEDNAYIVYIKDSVASVESLLTNYFVEHEKDPDEEINNIKKLIIYTVNAQYVENEDFDFINSNKMSSLEYLSLSNSRIKDGNTTGRIKSHALANKTTLKTVLLPKSLIEIGDYAFYNVNLGALSNDLEEDFEFLTIPMSVSKIGSNAFNASKYVKFKPTVPPEIGENAFGSESKLFVIAGTVEDYQNTPNVNNARVYQTGEVSDDRRYIVYETNAGLGLSYIVNNLLTGDTLGVPRVITYDGSNKNVTALGTNSYRAMNISNENGVNVTLPNTIDKIDSYAFYGLNITDINLDNVKEVGNYAFYNTNLGLIQSKTLEKVGAHAFEYSKASKVDLEKIVEIGESAFASSENLYEINLGNVKKIDANAFYDCKKVVRAFISNSTEKMVNNTETIDLEVGENALFTGWGEYVDGRLRVYVLNKTTSSGKTILDLYKEKFSDNSNYIYIMGNDIKEYKYMAVESPLYEYTVRQVTLSDHKGGSVTGLEIISYQGPDIDNNYQIPKTLEYNNASYDVISIGDSAYINTKVKDGTIFKIDNDSILNVSKNAFKNFNIKSFKSNGLVTLGARAFENSKLNKFEAKNLKVVENHTFYNCDELFLINLGNVEKIGEYAIANVKSLAQLFLNNESKNLSIANNALDNIGEAIGNRLRIYVPESEAQITYYKSLIPNYADYIYPTGITVGHYFYGAINYDIGEYTIREVSKINKDGQAVDGWELIEYHGPDLDSDFKIDEYVYSTTEDMGVNQILNDCTDNTCNISFALYNNSENTIEDWEMLFSATDGLVISNYAGEIIPNSSGDYITVKAATDNKLISPHSSVLISMTFTWNNNHDHVEILEIVPTMTETQGKKIISIGDYAFAHSKIVDSSSIDIVNTGLISLGDSSLANLRGIKKVELENVTNIGVNAFNNSSITQGIFKNLKTLKQNAFNNNDMLYKLDLGTVNTMHSKSLSNIPNLYQVFFSASGDEISLAIDEDALYNLGSKTNDRMRFYVTNGKTLNNDEYVDIYREKFSDTYKSYFYAYDFVMGTFIPSGISEEINIGAYSVKEVTLTDKNLENKFGYEYVEYHGEDIDPQFEFPKSLAISDNFLTATWTKENNWGSPGAYTDEFEITLTNNGTETISSWKIVLDILDCGEITSGSNWSNGVSYDGTRLTITNAVFNGVVKPNETVTIRMQVGHTKYDFTPRVHVLKGNASIADELPVISIGDYAFVHANTLPNAYFDINSEDIIKVGVGAFQNNSGIRKFIAKNSIMVGDSAFKNAYGLIQVDLESLKTLGSNVFYNANNLLIANLGETTSLKEGVLYGTTRLVQLHLNNKEVVASTNLIGIEISENAFTNMGSSGGNRLRIYVPDGQTSTGVTYLDAYKNALPSSLNKYVFEKGITVGEYILPNTDIDIGQYSIKKVLLDDVTGWQIIEYHGKNIDDSFKFEETLTIGEDTRPLIAIGPKAFYFVEVEDDYVWDLEINDIKYVYDYAFYQREINSLTADNVKYVGKYAFAENSKIISVKMENVENIDEHAFYRCTSLYRVNIGEKIKEIKDFAFYNSWVENSLTQVYINAKIPPTIYENTLPAMYWNDSNIVIYVPYESTSSYAKADYFKNYTINSIGSIYNYLYVYEIINNNQVMITNYIGNEKELVIPDVFTIDGINYNVVAIKPDTFDGTSRLHTLTLGAYVNNVGNGFLENNNTIQNIYVDSNNQYFSSSDGVLYDYNKETLIKYPRSKTLSDYTVLNTTKVISTKAFSNCSNLNSINLNNNLIAVSDSAFVNASGLKDIYFTSSTPPYLTGFEAFPMNAGLNIHHPVGAKDAYSTNVFFNWYSTYLIET